MPIDLEEIRAARAALTLLNPGRNPALHELIGYFGPVEALAWLTSPRTSPGDTADYLGGVSVEQFQTNAATLRQAAHHAGARVLIPEDDDWPARLDDLSQVAVAAAPSSALCLWVRGTAAIPARAVAITGSHDAPLDRVTAAHELGRGLAAAGWTVAATSDVGIAAAALRGALAAGGSVVAVLPGGIDQPAPAGTSALLTRIAENGLLVSASPPGTRAPRRRNSATGRLLAGLTSGTVLVETPAHSSNCLAALTEAADRGRRAMTVPVPVGPGACRDLRHGRRARPVHDTADVLAELPPLR
jgi:DNA processing protein